MDIPHTETRTRDIPVRARHMWTYLTTPVGEMEPEARAEARMLASVLLSMMLVGVAASGISLLIISRDDFLGQLFGSAVTLVLLFIPYAIARTPAYRTALYIAILVWDFVAVLNYLGNNNPAYLSYFLIPILLGALFTSGRVMLIIAIGHLALAFTLTSRIAGTSFADSFQDNMLPLLFITGLILVWFELSKKHEGREREKLETQIAGFEQEQSLIEREAAEKVHMLEDENQTLRRQLETYDEAVQALHESKIRLRRLSELTADYVYAFQLHADGTVDGEWHAAGKSALADENLIESLAANQLWGMKVHQDDTALAHRLYERLLAGEPTETEFRVVTRTGAPRWLRTISRTARDQDKRDTTNIYGVVQDVSITKRATYSLQQRNQELALLYGVIAITSRALELTTLLPLLQRQFFAKLQIPGGEILIYDEESDLFSSVATWGISRNIAEILPFSPRYEVEMRRRQIILDPDLWDLITQMDVSAHATWPGWKSHLCIPLLAGGQIQGAIRLFTRDRPISSGQLSFFSQLGQQIGIAIQNTKLSRQVALGRERVRRVAQQIVLAQEEERERIMRDLHEEANQALTTLALNIAAIRDALSQAGDRPEAASEVDAPLENVLREVEKAMVRVQLLESGLRPRILEHADLNIVLKQLCVETASTADLRVTFSGEAPLTLEDATRITLYRCLQEALANVVRHAFASRVAVKVGIDSQGVLLSVHDNGQGYDTALALEQGAGLSWMRQRLEVLEGQLTVVSQAGDGTLLRVWIPFSEHAAPPTGGSKPAGQSSASTGAIKLLIADRQLVIVHAISTWLEQEESFHIVGTVHDESDLLDTVARLSPDILLMDTLLSTQSAAQTLMTIQSRFPEVKLLIFTSDRDHVGALYNTDVKGYVLKNDAPELLLRALRTVALGGSWWSPQLVAGLSLGTPEATVSPLDSLTRRECELLQLMVDGVSNEEIAGSLVITVQTVRNHARNIYRKLGVSTRVEAILTAMQLGVGPSSTAKANGRPNS